MRRIVVFSCRLRRDASKPPMPDETTDSQFVLAKSMGAGGDSSRQAAVARLASTEAHKTSK